MQAFSFLLDIGLVVVAFLGLYQFRAPLATWCLRVPLSRFWLALLVSVPIILFEETINCIDYGNGRGCQMTWWINMVLFGEMAVLLFLAQKFKGVSNKVWLFLLATVGVLWELSFGGLMGLGPSFFLTFMIGYVMISYALLAVLPLEIIKIQK